MSFVIRTALKNIKGKPFRSAVMIFLVMLLSFALFSGAFIILSLQNGLSAYKARLGADIIVVPSSASGHGTVDDILLQGITGNYYMNKKQLEKLDTIEGIEVSSKSFFLTSAKASCCSVRVQIIGFDPDTDFTVMSWIKESFSEKIGDNQLVIGADVTVPADHIIRFYGKNYNVAAVLDRTGTGLDSAVYVNMNTVKQMAEDASRLSAADGLEGIDPSSAASAVHIKVKEGYDINDVTDDINIHVPKVMASSSRSMISSVSEGLSGVSNMTGFLVGAVWVMSLVIIIAVFAMVSNERKKEFAVLRTVGASKRILFGIMCAEAVVESVIGALAGLLAALLAGISLSGLIKASLGLPFVTPDTASYTVICVCSLFLSAAAGIITAFLSAVRITGNETGLLLREDA